MQPTASKVLLVDDEPDILDVLSEWLTLSGYQVQTASDGMKAIALAKQERFDLVISDLHMPGVTGLQLLAMLKALDPTVSIIILTGQGTMQDAIAALREGRAFDFLQKPLNDFQHLNRVIERALALRPAPPRKRRGSRLPHPWRPCRPANRKSWRMSPRGSRTARLPLDST